MARWTRGGGLQATGGSPLERALLTVIQACAHTPPDELAEVVRAAGSELGGEDTIVLLIDLAQQLLCPFDPLSGAEAGIQEVDGSAAGEAFRTEAIVEEAGAGRTRLWLPILDSAERVGVLGTTLDVVDDAAIRDWSALAALVGELVITKSRYGDSLILARRVHPVTVAAELRWGMLPPLTFSSPTVVVSGILEPAHEIAGDTFDYAISRSVAQVGVFDAIGHGLEASRMANLAVGTYRAARRRGEDLGATVRMIDEVIRREFGEWRFVTGQLATLDLDSGAFAAINAGHPNAMVYHRDGTREELRGPRSRPLGLETSGVPSVTTTLREGDVVLFHTDGVTEARSVADGFFGADRLYDVVGELLAAGHRPAEVLRQVVAVVLEHQPRPRDDGTLVLLGWRLGADGLAPASLEAEARRLTR